MNFIRHIAFLLLACPAFAAVAQVNGHLNVPGAQMVYSGFAPQNGLPQNQHYLLNTVHPDGTVDTMSSAYLVKQTLVYIDFVLLLYRNSNSVLSSPETGEVYLADYDSSLKGKPVQDQWPLVRYTIPANEGRAIVHVSLPAGRAYSGYRQPMLISYGTTSVTLNGRALGYVMPN
jgi:hypothetical protein